MKIIAKTGKITAFVVTILVIIFAASCNFRTIKGSGNVSSEVRHVSGFSGVDVSSALEVVYTEGPEYRLEVVADDNLISYIKTEVHGNKLRIGVREGKSFKKVTKTEVHITAPSLTDIELSGASRFEAVNTIHGTNLKTRLSGASSVVCSVELSSLQGDLSGASTLTVAGGTTNANLSASGASSYKTGGLTTEKAIIDFSGASTGEIKVLSTLVANLSGASRLHYSGNPSVSSNTSGGSTIQKQ